MVAYVSADCSSSDVLKCNSLENVFPPVNFKWPVNDADVQKLCEKLATGGKCLRDLIGNCLVKAQPNEAKFFNSVLDKEKSILTAMCASEASRGEFLKRTASCYAKKEVVEAVDNIHKRFDWFSEKFSIILKNINRCTIKKQIRRPGGGNSRL